MEFEITKLYEDTWAVEDGGVRFFVIAGSRKALVVDTGFGDVDVVAAARTLTDLPLMLLNTHADGDHIGGNSAFDWAYMHPSEGIVYHNISNNSGKTVPVWEGEIIDLGWRQLEIIHLPGHTPGSITVLDRTYKALIGGDSIQENGRIYMFGLHRDMEAYIASLRRLMDRAEDFDFIYPSHARLCVDKSIVPKLIDGAVSVLAGQVEGREEEVHGNRITAYDIGVDVFLCPPKA